MKRTPYIFGFFALAIYAIYMMTGQDTGSFFSWLESVFQSAALGVNSVVGNYIDKATNLIAGFEGFSGKAYPDPVGQTTTYSIGYGHQIRPGDGLSLESVLTPAKGLQLLNQDVQATADAVIAAIPPGLNDNQIAALISLAYNIGIGAFQNSTLLSLLQSGDTVGAADQFNRWIYSGGSVNQDLVDRRAKEEGVFNS